MFISIQISSFKFRRNAFSHKVQIKGYILSAEVRLETGLDYKSRTRDKRPHGQLSLDTKGRWADELMDRRTATKCVHIIIMEII